jgi:hypothetical protein
VVGDDKQRLDAREHRQRGEVARVDRGPDRRAHGPDSERRLDALGDGEPGRHGLVGPQPDHAAGLAMSAEQQPRRLDVGLAAVGADPGAMQRQRLAGQRVSDERDERRAGVAARMPQGLRAAQVAIGGRDRAAACEQVGIRRRAGQDRL